MWQKEERKMPEIAVAPPESAVVGQVPKAESLQPTGPQEIQDKNTGISQTIRGVQSGEIDVDAEMKKLANGEIPKGPAEASSGDTSPSLPPQDRVDAAADLDALSREAASLNPADANIIDPSAADREQGAKVTEITSSIAEGGTPPPVESFSLSDPDKPPLENGKTLNDALTDLDASPRTQPSPNEEAAILRAGGKPAEAAGATPIEPAGATPPKPPEFAGAAPPKPIEPAGATPPSVEATTTDAAPAGESATATTEAAGATPPVEAKAADGTATETPKVEAATDKTTSKEVKAETDPKVEAALNLHKVLNKLESAIPNFDAGSDLGKAFAKDIMDNPDQADKILSMIDTVDNQAKDAVAQLASNGINIDAGQLTAAMLGNVTEQYMVQLDKEQAVDSSDPGKAEAVKKKGILKKILKGLLKVALYAGAAALIVPGAAVAGTVALGAAGKK